MSRRADLGSALVWFGLGAAITVAAWRMDRLGHQGISPWSAPGVTPGAIGVLMMLFALALGAQALRGGAGGAEEQATTPADFGDRAVASTAPPGSAWGTLVAAVLCVLFVFLSLGRGAPFAVEAAVFIALFTSFFSWRIWRDEGRVERGLARTLAIAIAAAVFISWLFEQVFLVRLP
jgi:hypothetical protein